MINLKKTIEVENDKIDELLSKSEKELSNPNTKFLTQEEVIKEARRVFLDQ